MPLRKRPPPRRAQPGAALHRGRHRAGGSRRRTDAAVLVPLYLDRGRLHAVFTKRQDDLRRHPGEISFPGGRYDEGERDLRATALREANEEIGLPTDAVEIVGALQPTSTIATGYAVYPFVGLIEPGRTWTPSARRGGRGPRALARRRCWPDTRVAGSSGAACRSGPTRTSSATTSSGAPRPGSWPTCSTGSGRCSRPVRPAAQPFSIGTLTRLPHSVHDPS